MRALIQRVSSASVTIEQNIISSIPTGLLIFLGIEDDDTHEDVLWLAGKISKLRIFPDAQGKMNASIIDICGRLLVVSQFTLHASTRKGNRPSFIKAARPDIATPLYELFLSHLKQEVGQPIESGIFGADMQVTLVNDGPVTIWIDSKAKE